MRRRLWMLLACLIAVPTSAVAQRLPKTVTPEHYDLAFTVDIPNARFEGTTAIRVNVVQPTAQVVLNAAELDFHTVSINSSRGAERPKIAFSPRTDRVTLTLERPLPRGTADIHITYSGVLNDKLRGFYLSKGPGRNYAVTQLESTDARRAFPCFDEPAYKATFTVALTIDRGDTAISNGRVVSDTPGPGASQHTVKFTTTPKMSTYLVAMAIGDFACLDGNADQIPIRICATPDKKDLGRLALESTQEILRFYNRYYTIPYPFGKLDIVAVPDFAAGAMENTAAIFYRESELLAATNAASIATRKNIASVLAHEIAHQWFGDLVTMQWWNDLWLNEGFATWMANRPLEAWKPEWHIPVDEARGTQTALELDSLGSTHAIRAPVETPAEIDAAFDSIAYEKGAAVLRMIERYVGASVFRAGVNAYLQKHAYANATSEDFWNAISAASGKPVDKILSTFTSVVGAPLIEVSRLTCTGSSSPSTRITVTPERFTLDSDQARPSSAWQIPVCLRASADPTAAAMCSIVNRPAEVDVTRGCSTWVFANAGAQGYYRTAYPPNLLSALAPQLFSLTAPERVSLMGDEWAMVLSGRHHADDYLTLASGFGRESSSGVFGQVAERLAFVHQYLTTDATRPRFESFVRRTLQPLFTRLGFAPNDQDDDERRALRAAVVSALGTTGNDADIAARARIALDRALDGRQPLDPTLAPAIVTIAAAHGDRDLFRRLTLAAAKATSPDEENLYLDATASFRDPQVIADALNRALQPEMRAQDAGLFLASFLQNPAARTIAWSFIKTNWSSLVPKLDIFGGGAALHTGLATFCDRTSRDDIAAFFRTHRISDDSGETALTIERIDDCIRVAERETARVGDWLATQ